MIRNKTRRIASIVTVTTILLSTLAVPATAGVAQTAGDSGHQSMTSPATTSFDEVDAGSTVVPVDVSGERLLFDEEDDGGSVDVSVSGETCYTVIGAAGFSIEVCVSVTSE